MLVVFPDESLWMPLISPVRCVHLPVVPYHRDSMSPRACSEFRLRPSCCHREIRCQSHRRPRIWSFPCFPEKKMRVPSFANESTKLDETRRNSKLDESSLVVVWVICEVDESTNRDESRLVDLVFLDVVIKPRGTVPKLKEHFLRCISHQSHGSQHCICSWMLFQQLHFVLVACILMGRSDLDDVINC